MRAQSGWAALAAAVVVAGIVAAGLALPETLTSTDLAEPAVGRVSERTTACPALARTADGSESVTAFVAPDVAAGTGSIGVAGEPAIPLPEPGAAVRVTPESDTSVTVRATGDTAAGTATVREYHDAGEEGRGLAIASCAAPRAVWWFVGVSGAPGHIDQLLLFNPTGSPAVVSVDVYGPAGRIDVLGVGGVTIQPGGQSIVRVDSLIPGVATATLRIRTSGGLVSAALRATAIDGLIPRGAEYLPPAAEPAAQAVVPGVLGGEGSRELIITAPDADAAVDIAYLTESGPLDRPGTAQVPIPAGHTVVVDIDDDLAGRAAAVVITGSAAVTAAVRSTVSATLPPDATGVLNRLPVADIAATAAARPVAERLVLPVSGAAEAPAAVLLSSTGGAATVTVKVRDASGAAVEQVVEVADGWSATVPVPVMAEGASLITVERTPGSGGLFAAVVQTGLLPTGPIAAAATGEDPSVAVTIPLAYPDPQALAGE